VNYAKLLEMNSFFSLHSFLEVGKTQDLPSEFWQTLGDALTPKKLTPSRGGNWCYFGGPQPFYFSLSFFK
jgi:hypothetical protein